MTLYEYLKMTEGDFDTYDTEYDAEVTVCYIADEDEDNDEYNKFCNGIIKKVNVVKVNGNYPIVDWCELIKRNMEKFKEFTSKYWNYQYEDDEDELIYQWINEIHLYMAGYTSESVYAKLNTLVNSLE